MRRTSVRPRRAIAAGVALAFLPLLAPAAASAGNNSWSAVGPQGAIVLTLAVDPSSPATVYAGTYAGYVYKSANGGATWAAANGGLPVVAGSITSLVSDPSHPATLYAASGAGIWKSMDGALTWNQVTPAQVLSLLIDPSSPATLYASTGSGLIKTTDGGATWTTILQQESVTTVALGPSPPVTVYVGTEIGLFKSVDGGATWLGVGPAPDPISAIAVDPAHSGTVYTGLFVFGVYKSTDGGTTWNPTKTGLPFPFEAGTMAVDPNAPGTVYATNDLDDGPHLIIYRTLDGGATWSAMDSGLPNTAVIALAFDPANSSVIYAATTSGVAKTSNAGAVWSTIDSGLTDLEIDLTAIDPTNSATLYAAARGNGLFKSADGSATWTALGAGLDAIDFRAMAIDPSHPATLYLATDSGIFKSIDGGADWIGANAGITGPNGPLPDCDALAIDPRQPATLYAGTEFGTVKSTDGANSWTTLTALEVLPGTSELVIDPSQANTLYAINFSGRLVRSTDGGITWNASDADMVPAQDQQTFFVSDLAIDPASPANRYAATSNGFFRSSDAGATWTAANCGLPAVPHDGVTYDITTLVVDPRSPGTVYALSFSRGVFKTVDFGVAWNPVDAGMPAVQVTSLAFNPKTSTLYAGTEGLSVFAFTDTGQTAPSSSVLCIDHDPGDARFTVRVHFQTQQSGGESGEGHAVSLTSVGVDHGGLFWFFDAGNPEMLVKVINGCALDQKFWLFYSAGTNVGLTTTVTDNATGEVKTYANPDLTAAPPVQDTAAFDCLSSDAAPSGEPLAPRATGTATAECSPGLTTLCISGRFKVDVAYHTTQDGGQSGPGQAIALDSVGVDQGGLFWFFSQDNPEMLIKVIDACSLQGKYWVFYSADTNVGLKVTVTDTHTGKSAVYTNRDLTPAAPVQDTSALPCG